MHCYYSMNKYIHIYILIILIYLTRGNGNFLNARSRDYGMQRTADSNKLVKGEDGTPNVNTGLVEDGGVRAVGEVFVPKTFPMSSQEPSCEQLRAMWIFSKRQSRAAEITNEIPTYRDPFTYNVWEPLYSNSRLLGSLRMGARERARSPVFGRVVSREPIIPQRVTFEQRQRHMDGSQPGASQARLYGAEIRPINAGSPAASSSPRRSSKNRHVGVPSSSGSQNSVAVQGSFQKLKELIWTERAKELTQQRRAEEVAARAAVLKEIANGQNIQSSYKLPFNNAADSILMDENRSPDSSGNQYLSGDRMSIANIQNFDANNKNGGHRNGGARASTRRIGSAYETGTNGNGPARKDSFFSGNSPAGQPKTVSRLRIPLTEMNPADLADKHQTVIGIPRTYPIRQSHFRERNRSLLKQYPPNEYFERNTRILKSLQFGPPTELSKVRGDFNDNYLSPYASIEYGLKPGINGLIYFGNDPVNEAELTALSPQIEKTNQYEYDFYNNNGY
ncbi:uncharacterized protein [Drosophila virilis]|uniref:Uncharacterized protein, isoform A n=1 Tax=Drosophila virilis TaxID=7244 RepID=B4MF36_DROVI|nr:uncharacterized protein LOC6636193 isoform X1 [Drosophila virilis]XP_032290136.1 uncharacterized protein LOC6636193 isoform X1 [Drosophila virilis]XP_032290137.1 uncharacterized protein LOC6636193 isoform X1 [Drosophila virilis]EDW71137.2 uncharacterized protein Dvir_GJ18775, isoform A [Drosophila virilis]KRF85396.1 uncharacterized protein Dvir_GJ18775, isoform C [Drosophila virilis]